jgi:transposase-like protein
MNIHKNARLTLHGRAEMGRRVVECGQSLAEVAERFHVCVKTARKWAERCRRSGAEGLSDVCAVSGLLNQWGIGRGVLHWSPPPKASAQLRRSRRSSGGPVPCRRLQTTSAWKSPDAARTEVALRVTLDLRAAVRAQSGIAAHLHEQLI